MLDVSAIVVTYNSASELGPCLDALRECRQVIVVDNASIDNSVAVASARPGVYVVSNTENEGFAGAVNRAALSAVGRYLLLVNPDAVLASGLESLIRSCGRSGIAAGCLTNPDGSPQAGFAVRRLPTPAALAFECLGLNRIWPRNPVNARYRCRDLDLTRPCQVEQPAGAFLMIRRDVFDQLGGFDEAFWPVWFEDVDFCRRALDAGVKIEYVPDARALHSGGHSVNNLEGKYRRLYWYGSLLRYSGKYYGRHTFRVVCGCILIGIAVRLSAGMLSRGSRRSRGEYKKVGQMAAAGLLAGRFVPPTADADRTGWPAAAGVHPVMVDEQGVDEN